MLREILPDEASRALAAERDLLERIGALAARVEPRGDGAERMARLARNLDEMFLLVVVGEVKAGKSAFLNALLQADVCPEGPLPLTDRVHLIGYGDREGEQVLERDIVRRELPLDVLRNLSVVDTPGTNAPEVRHESITEGFLPRADIVFFVTSIDRPLPRSELALLRTIHERLRKTVACVLAKVDLHPDEDRRTVSRYLRETFRERLGFEPPVFAVAAHEARDGRAAGDAARVEASGMPEVERYVVEHLSEERRLQLKLQSPLGPALDLVRDLERQIASRRNVLEEDFAGVRALREQVEHFRGALPERAEARVAQVASAFEDLETRGRAFLREAVRWRNLKLLMSSTRFVQAFEREVIGAAATDIERETRELTRWLARQTKALWERAQAHFDGAHALDKYRDEILTGAGPTFRETRRETLEAIRAAVRAQLESWSVEGESKRIRAAAAAGMQRALGVEIAAGTGLLAAALVPAIATGVGVALAAAVAVGGLLIVPYKREKAVRGFERGVRETRAAVLAALREAVKLEAGRAADGILEAFAPFRDFYEARQSGLEDLEREAAGRREELETLRAGLE